VYTSKSLVNQILTTHARVVGRKLDLELELPAFVRTIIWSGYPACPSMNVVFLRIQQDVAHVFFLEVRNFLVDTLERCLYVGWNISKRSRSSRWKTLSVVEAKYDSLIATD